MQTDTFQKAKIVLMALLLAVGLILILLAFRPQMAQVSTSPIMSMSVIGALQPASLAKPVEVPVGSHIDTDGRIRINPPADWQAIPDCRAQGMRRWTHEDASGNISYYCKK